MFLRKACFAFIVLISFIVPSSASAFEWRATLNLRAHADPYGYRYGLMHRFGVNESHVMAVLSRVYEPADAYMVFRLTELSGFSSEHVLNIYHERRHYGWEAIASVLGIRFDRPDFLLFREYHDMKEVYYDYNYRRKERYEEHYRPHVQHHYVPQSHKHFVPPKRHPTPKPQHYEQPRHERTPDVHERSKTHGYHQQYEPKKYETHHQRPPHNHSGHYDGQKSHHQR